MKALSQRRYDDLLRDAANYRCNFHGTNWRGECVECAVSIKLNARQVEEFKAEYEVEKK